MAEICWGVVGESEPAAAMESNSRNTVQLRLELRPLNLADDADVPPPENGQKRRKLEIRPSSPARHCENAIKNCEANEVKPTEEIQKSEKKEALDPNQLINLKVKDWPKFGVTTACGRRREMEDTVSIHPLFLDQDRHFFGVFDGHGCSHVAMKCENRLHEIVKEEVEGLEEEEGVDWKDAMERSFEKVDKEACDWSICALDSSCSCDASAANCIGSTAVVAVLTPEKIVVSNCGDSRAVLCRNGVAVPLSFDHKPDRLDEVLRIEAAGGQVFYWDGPRVFGVLAMSRAIGDAYLKPYVVPEPEVTITDRAAEDEFLILASDGLWDVVSNDTACRVAGMCLRSEKSRSLVGAGGRSSDRACLDATILLTKLALARDSSDNVSVVVVDLRKS